MSRHTRAYLFIGVLAAVVSLIALTLVGRLVSALDDPQLAGQMGWYLLVVGFSSAVLSAVVASVVVWRIRLPLKDSQRSRELSYVEAVGAIVTAADARDQETTGHSFRVALYAVELARRLGVEGEELKAIEWGALLHDVGKMVVPDEILRKGNPLNEDEWLIMKQHPSWGYEMLAEVSFLRSESLDLIYSHHERWDGDGYPRGLAGEEIPLVARIFAAVDTYDAITSDRPYRRARPHSVAMAELEKVAGHQLDP
ncbi:MAG TPA: HD-GYP domain-containing protein, partial [Thermoanaerobaculia bacterium]|nr:HD-GYP domain-containing protein [Thermoanaerobaculia bacterium]